jgi:putative ABC transport system permease protein
VLQDLRFAIRLFRKYPAPVGIAVGGLALAIGVVTAVFSLVDASMLRPYGMDDPASVVTIARPDHGGWSQWSYARFLQLRDGSTLGTIEASMPSRIRFSTLAADDSGPKRDVLFVSGGYLPMLGGRTSRGRGLGPTDDTPGAPAVIVVSDHFWKTELDSDPDVVGKTVWLNGSAVSIVGVLRPEFTGPVKVRPSIWATFEGDRQGGQARGTAPDVEVIARLAPGATTRAMQDQLSGVVRGWSTSGLTSRANGSGPAVRLYSAASPIDLPDDAESVFVMATTFGALGLVLALACANTANLLMAAAATRAQEIGVRLAMGASTRRLLRQMVSESLLLGGLAGALGFLLAIWLAPILRAVIQLSPEIDIAPDGRVLLFAVAVALLCGVGCGLSPARYGVRGNLLSARQSQSGSRGAAMPSRFRTWFVGFQAAVSVTR